MITVNNDEKLITVNEMDINLLQSLLLTQLEWNKDKMYDCVGHMPHKKDFITMYQGNIKHIQDILNKVK